MVEQVVSRTDDSRYSQRMSVNDVRATLSIYGEGADLTAAAVTAALGVEPTSSYEFGDPVVSKSPALNGTARTHSHWSFVMPGTVASNDDPHGMESLAKLAEMFESKAGVLVNLSARYEIRVWMTAFSDSTQGGFVVDPVTMRRLGMLSAALFGTVYLSEDD
jgi:hypothetical protein